MTVVNFPGTKPPEDPPTELSCIEPVPASEYFCGDLARVLVLGQFARLVWTVPDIPVEGPDTVQNLVTVKIVLPTSALPAIHETIGRKLASIGPTEDGEVSTTDPVFAAIDLHNQLDSASNALLRRELTPGEDGFMNWRAESEAATTAWSEARDAMFRTVPTTRAGAKALVAMLDRDDPEPEELALLVHTLAEAVPARR
jgi:hypothetical protein